MGGCSQEGTYLVFPLDGTRSLEESACLWSQHSEDLMPALRDLDVGGVAQVLGVGCCTWDWVLQKAHAGASQNAAASGAHSLLPA